MNTHSPQSLSATRPPTARQAEILDRAAELVAESGLAHLTMKRLAERVGFTEPALYRHYAGKSALLAAMIERLSGRLLPTMAAIAEDRQVAPADRLLAMVRHHVALLRLIGAVGGVMRRYIGLLGGVLGELGLDTGVSPERQAILFLGLPAAIGIQMRAFPDMALSDDETERLVAHYVRSLTAPAAPAASGAPGGTALRPETRP